MTYSTVIWDTQSGERLAHVEASSGSWQRGRVVQQEHTFPLRSLGLSRAEAHDLFGRTRPRDRVLSVLWDGVPVYHGLVIDSDYDKASGLLTVKHNDVRELASARWLHGIGGSGVSFTFAGLSLRGIAQAVAKIVYTDPISGAWPLPVTIPTPEAGGASMTVHGYEFKTGEDILAGLEETDGGPDIDFRPTRGGDGRFGWVFEAGDPHLSGPGYEFHAQAAVSSLRDLKVTTIGAEKVTGVHGIGEGSEWDMIRGGAAAPVSAGLARDTKLTVKDAQSVGVVNARAAGYLASRLATYQQWSFNVQIDETGIDPAELRLGSIIRVESRGDEWIDDGWTEHRVVGFSGSYATPNTLSLTTEVI